MVLSDVWWFRYYTNGNIIPLDGLIKQLDIKMDDFQKSLVADYQYDGQAVGAPLRPFHARCSTTTRTTSRPPDCRTAPRRPGRSSPSGRPSSRPAPARSTPTSTRPWPATPAGPCRTTCGAGAAAGPRSGTFNCDSAESVAALQWAQDSIYKDKWAGVSSKEAADDFAAGITSSTISSTGSLLGVLKSAKFNVGVGYLPGGPKSDSPVCPTGGAGLGIPSGISKEVQLAAATFLKFMTEPENTAAVLRGHRLHAHPHSPPT